MTDWKVFPMNLSTLGGPHPPYTPYSLNLSYYGKLTRGGIYGIPSLLPGTIYDGHNTIGNNYNHFSWGTTVIQLTFDMTVIGTFPIGGFVLDIEDISIQPESKTYWASSPPPTTPWGSYGSFVEVVLAKTTSPGYQPSILPWREDTGHILYTPWPDDAYEDNALMSAGGGIYSRRLIRMPKYGLTSYFNQLYFRFYNQHLDISGGITQWYIHNLYWRDASDSSDHLIWSPPI